jgi:sugar phosphate isomerase/epimerase
MCLTGEGDIPHDEAVRLLASINFQGALSGEWINFLPPEQILPQNADVMRRYIEQARAGA